MNLNTLVACWYWNFK